MQCQEKQYPCNSRILRDLLRTLSFCHYLKSKIHYGGHSNACVLTASSAHRGAPGKERKRIAGEAWPASLMFLMVVQSRAAFLVFVYFPNLSQRTLGGASAGGGRKLSQPGRAGTPTHPVSHARFALLKRGRKTLVEASLLSSAGFFSYLCEIFPHFLYRPGFR